MKPLCHSVMFHLITTIQYRGLNLMEKWGFPVCSYPPKVVYCFYTSEFLNPVSRTSFIGMTWNIFCERFRPPEIQIYKKMFVILWFCHFVIGNTYLITRFLYLNIIQSSPNLAQLFIGVASQDSFLFFSNFQFFTPRWRLVFFWHTKIFPNFRPIYMKFGIKVYL